MGARVKNERINGTQVYPEKLLKTKGNQKRPFAHPAILMKIKDLIIRCGDIHEKKDTY